MVKMVPFEPNGELPVGCWKFFVSLDMCTKFQLSTKKGQKSSPLPFDHVHLRKLQIMTFS